MALKDLLESLEDEALQEILGNEEKTALKALRDLLENEGK